MRIMKSLMYLWIVASLSFMLNLSISHGDTIPEDVFAINNLYIELGYPALDGWVALEGDPCGEGWQGVECVESNITAIKLSNANLRGQLSDKILNFQSILTLDLSNNQIGGTIPEFLPVTMRQFLLSRNLLTGSIPASISALTLLENMSLHDNLLTGVLPDSFKGLTELVNMDLSSNNLGGILPQSMKNLSSLISLHLQNNHLTGVLDVLQDLPLQELIIENNLFSGLIPAKLINIPIFKMDGNLFNTSPAFSLAPSPTFDGLAPENSHEGSNSSEIVSKLKFFGIAAGVVILLFLMFITIKVCIKRQNLKKSVHEETSNEPEGKMETWLNAPLSWAYLNELRNRVDKDDRQSETTIDMADVESICVPPPVERITSDSDSIYTFREGQRNPSMNLNQPTSATCYSVATLQQYTNSFSEENMIQESELGLVYLAEFPQNEFLAVLKLNGVGSTMTDDKFLELVLSISKIEHPCIVELVGYCMEYDQRLLVYKYFSRYTLYDILHYEDKLNKKLTWNARIQVALDAAKALKYLHETFHPPIVVQNFNSKIILLDDDLTARISECGFATVLGFGSDYQLPQGVYPSDVDHFDIGHEKGNVYSFGVVMLELLTGRKPYDSSLHRREQHLATWASFQLHDIDALTRMVDPSFGGKYPMKSLSRFADIISRCIQQVPEFRPPMSEVVQDLSRIMGHSTITAM